MAQQSVNVNFSVGGTEGTIPGGAQNIVLTLAGARGGVGGYDAGGPGGDRGRGRSGTFNINSSNNSRVRARVCNCFSLQA